MRLLLDSRAYSLEAVQKAAYRFIDKLTVQISINVETIECEVQMNDGKEIDLTLVDALKREFLDQELRLKIKKETEAQRNLILAYVFSKSGLQE